MRSSKSLFAYCEMKKDEKVKTALAVLVPESEVDVWLCFPQTRARRAERVEEASRGRGQEPRSAGTAEEPGGPGRRLRA